MNLQWRFFLTGWALQLASQAATCTSGDDVAMLQIHKDENQILKAEDVQNETTACTREPASRHLPEDLRECTSPAPDDVFDQSWKAILASNPYQPGCWEASSLCAPFKCSVACDAHMAKRLRFWEPVKPGNLKALVFQYGKVASSGLVGALKTELGIEAAHAHLAEEATRWLQGQPTAIPVQQQGFALSREWSLMPGDTCFIITAARSHASRDPSEYFENILDPRHPYGYHPRGRQRYQDTPPAAGEERWTREMVQWLGESNISALLEDFHAQHPILLEYYAKWFSQVFGPATGANILSGQFDAKKKYQRLSTSRCTVLALRYEDSKDWDKILSEFFPGFRLPKFNRATKKWYNLAHQNFLKNLKYSPEELDEMCQTETEMHFYNSDPSSPCAQRS